ncbi:aldo/keto reductase family oxidoreductase [Jiangella ureilytica]|uniref:Aldo/keto reductase family oxidoreductase n=1 Tax=Jiangella ureilytica TaxID=2530374 RepID=A0A4R4RJU8_9ACTN|nr:aldo/keto reductase [Jiangella ureilytica]TDC49634.1 aldo/keto reductase family oxidoreductase [Jiangella ureilytica]
MEYIDIGGSGLRGSVITLGCMRIDQLSEDEVAGLIGAAADAGITVFDHADIYGGGRCEEVFGAALGRTSVRREDIVVQTKCGIRSGYYDFSAEHIRTSVEGSLRRLNTDYVDLLLLHRPDTLMEPEDVAAALDELVTAGKVRHVGVSNQNPAQLELLRAHIRQPIVADQLQFSLAHTPMIDAGLNVNTGFDGAVVREGGVLEYCRLHGITIQPWSVLQHGQIAGTFLGNPAFRELNDALDEVAAQLGATPAAVAIAWILRHPARMQPVIGTTKPARVEEIAKAAHLELSRETWYALYRAAGNEIL